MASNKHLALMIRSRCPNTNIHGKKPTNKSKKQNITHAINFAKWANKNYRCRNFEDFKSHIQDYENHLLNKNLAPSTIHTYVAGCCYVWGISMVRIDKPIRRGRDFTKSRGEKEVDKRSDAKREISPWLYDLALKLGGRREDYAQLTTENFVFDESGYPCVEFERSKGGKRQFQRILPEDLEFVKSYFEDPHGGAVPERPCDPEKSKTQNTRYKRLKQREAEGLPTKGARFIFSKKEMRNKLDFHGIRHDWSRKAYYYYLNRLAVDPTYREQLEHEIKMRWIKENVGAPWKVSCVRGVYRIRGGNREKAEELGLPIEYDRLALMAVSVFHLSHWRCNVAISNYLLAM